jgi:hypothetical protein
MTEKINEKKLLRPLKTSDLGLFSKIVSKMEVKNYVKSLFVDITGKNEDELEALEKQLGIDFMFIILENYWKAEKEFHKLLSSMSGKTEKQIADSSPTEFIGMLKELTQDENFEGFFNLVVQ